MLNKRSDYLVILLATYNRLESLKRAIDSIESGTRCSHELIVIDGGSTDGTIEFLRTHPGVTPVFQGKLVGQARACNEVWRQIESRYTCWLSDDVEVVNGSLDLAVGILEKHPDIGMVGLKMKDTWGPWKDRPYMGKLSKYGILNCNHGVLSTRLLRSVGYFSEEYQSYTIDPDLTASILCTGHSVVMTKHIGVLHHRGWGLTESKERWTMPAEKNIPTYLEKFKFLDSSETRGERRKIKLGRYIKRLVFKRIRSKESRLGLNRLDWKNITEGRFIHLTDPIECIFQPYHLIQRIPRKFLRLKSNPYRNLVKNSRL